VVQRRLWPYLPRPAHGALLALAEGAPSFPPFLLPFLLPSLPSSLASLLMFLLAWVSLNRDVSARMRPSYSGLTISFSPSLPPFLPPSVSPIACTTCTTTT